MVATFNKINLFEKKKKKLTHCFSYFYRHRMNKLSVLPIIFIHSLTFRMKQLEPKSTFVGTLIITMITTTTFTISSLNTVQWPTPTLHDFMVTTQQKDRDRRATLPLCRETETMHWRSTWRSRSWGVIRWHIRRKRRRARRTSVDNIIGSSTWEIRRR